jgi:hypothetical protein
MTRAFLGQAEELRGVGENVSLTYPNWDKITNAQRGWRHAENCVLIMPKAFSQNFDRHNRLSGREPALAFSKACSISTKLAQKISASA